MYVESNAYTYNVSKRNENPGTVLDVGSGYNKAEKSNKYHVEIYHRKKQVIYWRLSKMTEKDVEYEKEI